MKELQTISWTDFYKNFITIHDRNPDYRLGQHFINMLIVHESDELLEGLWYMTGDEAFMECMKIIDKYQWDVTALPLANQFK